VTASFAAGPPGLLRALNARAVLETVAAQGPTTRADVAAVTQLSKPTVAACLASLVERGAVQEDGAVSGRKGPAATLYRLAPQAVWAIGLDIGHDRLRGALVDAAGEQRGHVDVPVRRRRAALTRQVREVCERLASTAGITLAEVHHVVVGVPGAVGPDGALAFADALPQDGEGLVAALRAQLPVPVTFDNDVNLAALAELAAQPDVEDFVLVSVGAGIGAGLVIGGQVHRGVSGAAGEVGFLPGCAGDVRHAPQMIEHEVGGEVVSRLAREAGLPGDPGARAVFELARTGDLDALAAVDATARGIAFVVACLVAVLNPSRVVVGGSVGSNADLLLDPVRQHLSAFTTLRVPVVTSSVGVDAVLHGSLAMAAGLARESAFAAFTGAPTEHTIQQIQPTSQHLVARES
jgi:predicted NBD/HSP70 family sugar kinase